MPGFFGFISNREEILDNDINIYDIVDENQHLIEEEREITTSMLYGKFFRNAVKKFEKDRAFYENQHNFSILDGVILNKIDLYKEYSVNEDRIEILLNKMSNVEPKTFLISLEEVLESHF